MPLQALSGSLEVLSAAQCGLQAVAGLAGLGLLQALDLSSNAISDAAQVPKVLAGCQHLRSLSLQGNPICKQTTYRWGLSFQAVTRISLCPIPEQSMGGRQGPCWGSMGVCGTALMASSEPCPGGLICGRPSMLSHCLVLQCFKRALCRYSFASGSLPPSR